jgi:hypothetical protein
MSPLKVITGQRFFDLMQLKMELEMLYGTLHRVPGWLHENNSFIYVNADNDYDYDSLAG